MELNLIQVSQLEIKDFLGKTARCECGKNHSVDMDTVIIEKGAIGQTGTLLEKLGYKKALLVADSHTYAIAGQQVEAILEKEQFIYKSFVFPVTEDLVPDEAAVGRLLIEVERDTDVIVAVGSGTLNDLTKFVSFQLGIDSIIVATAPSMDGFASTGAALIVGNLKTSYETACPKAIIGDIGILQEAPMEMILAGVGDIVGKYSALADWKISSIINEEYYCEVIVKMVTDSVEKCIGNIENIKNRDDTAIKNLMESLVLTGIAMSFAGNSRPASGSEHHLAHYWEMLFLFEGKKAVLHGTKVGIASGITTALYEWLGKTEVDFDQAVSRAHSFSIQEWSKQVNFYYRKAAPEILRLSRKDERNSVPKRIQRIERARKKWSVILKTIHEIPSAGEIGSLLNLAGAPIRPQAVGITAQSATDGILMAKEVRSRYTILGLLSDLGLLDDFVRIIQQTLHNGESGIKINK